VAPIFAWLGLAGLVQSAGNTTGWVFMCQGKTKTMFQWGVYASATTIAAFVVGLPWGAVGVAAAYAISSYVVRVPVLTWLMHRIGRVSAYDFLMVQFLYLVSSLATWGIFNAFPDLFVRSSHLMTVIFVTALSYLLAGLLTVALPEPRHVAFVIGKKVIGAIR
jgi:PST family polysaccharide transporter